LPKNKENFCKYGTLPEKEAEAEPWEKLCVDMVGPYKLGPEAHTLWCVTVIDPATGWLEMKEVKNKEAFTVATAVEQTWLNCYSWPTEIIFDKGSEIMAQFI
jgi:hypothetical protein